MLTWTTVISLALYSLPLFSQEIVGVHPQVCNLLKKTTSTPITCLTPQIHHHTPSAGEIKLMIKSKLLVTPAKELVPWIEKIIKKRQKPTITLNQFPINSYSAHINSHFWSSPSNYCHQMHFLQQQMEHLGFNVKKSSCKKMQTVAKDFAGLASKMDNYKIILTHAAFLPIFQKNNYNVFSIKNADHHSPLGAQEIKALEKIIAPASKVIWIMEKNILNAGTFPQRYINKKHLVLEINSYGKYGEEPENILLSMVNFFEKILKKSE